MQSSFMVLNIVDKRKTNLDFKHDISTLLIILETTYQNSFMSETCRTREVVLNIDAKDFYGFNFM